MNNESTVALIGLDWGTSSLRAYLFGADGTIIARCESGQGVQKVQRSRFREALDETCAEWLNQHPKIAIIASGMIGSQQGLRDAGYQHCPIGLAELGLRLCEADDLIGRRFRIVPGVLVPPTTGRTDIMRGEETQILGLASMLPVGTGYLVMPGTHSKWVRTRDGRIERFRSFLTGELFEAIARHTIVGRLFPSDQPEHHTVAFVAGLDAIRHEPEALSALLFSVRIQGILKERPLAELPSYLSGLLIGAELNAALAANDSAEPLTLVGERVLCERYAQALAHFGHKARFAPADVAAAGLFALGKRAGLLPD